MVAAADGLDDDNDDDDDVAAATIQIASRSFVTQWVVNTAAAATAAAEICRAKNLAEEN